MLKVVFIILFLVPGVASADYPSAKAEYVNDFAKIIDNTKQKALKKELRDTEYYSGVEIVVVTVKSYGHYKTGASSWEEFSTSLFNKWGIGNLPDNNGVLVLVSKEDRKIRIELGAGYPSHYDAIMKSIIEDEMVPELKNGNYTAGIINGTRAVIEAVTVSVSFFEWYKNYILAGILAVISTLAALYAEKTGKRGLFWVFISLAGFLVLGLLRSLSEGNRSDGHGGGSSSGGGASGDF